MKKSLGSWFFVVLFSAVGATAGFGQGPAGQAPRAGQPQAAAQGQRAGGPTMQAATPRLAVREVVDDVYQIALGLDSVCMYVLVGRDKALVVDTQTMADFEGKKIIDYVKDITKKPLIVVNTHPHIDHVAGNDQFGEVYLSAPGIEELKAGAARRNTTISYTMKPLKQGDLLDLGDRQVEVIAIPAHSTGSLAYLDRKAGYLFTGDEIDPGQVVGMNPEKIKQHYANMKKLYDQYYSKVSLIIPAHNGAPVTKRYIKYFMDLDAKVMAGTATEVPLGDGPNYGFPAQPGQARYRENFAAVIYSKTAPAPQK